MEEINKKSYTKEFKKDIVTYYKEHDITLDETAAKFEVSRTSISNWIRELKEYKEDAFVGSGKLHKEDEEIKKLKQRLKDAEEEAAILKKAMAIFSRGI